MEGTLGLLLGSEMNRSCQKIPIGKIGSGGLE
jgi:hypothetical protein